MTGPWTLDELLADVARGPQGPAVGAFFDVDGTLIDGHSLGAFARHHARSGHATPLDRGRLLLIGLRLRNSGGATDEQDVERFFRRGMRAWAGRDEQQLTELGERLWRQGVAGSLYPEAWRLVAAHRAAGHTVVLASSATRFQVEPAARAMGVGHVLVTGVEFVDGLATGRPAGPPLRRSGKAAAVRAFAAPHGVDLESSYAYSDGTEDEAFLASVGRARALNPEPGLASAARERGWPVVRFRPRGHRPGPVDVLRTAGAFGGVLGGFGAGMALRRLSGGSRREAVDAGIALAGDLGAALGGITLVVRGAEHLRTRPVVYLFNHQSRLDVIVLTKLLRGGVTAVAKKELQRTPGFGRVFTLADVAFVDRGDSTSARAALEPAVQRLREGLSLAIAPEGTRSPTPALGPFKKGAFHVALQAGVPIVPVVIHDAGALMWRDAPTLASGTITVDVLAPVPTDDWTVETLDSHVAAVRALYLDALGQTVPTGAAVEVITGPPAPDDDAEPLGGTDDVMDTDATAVWRAETGGLRDTVTVLERLDRAPARDRLTAAHEWASRMVPRMRQVVSDPALRVGPPVWTTLEHPDLDRHLRHVRLPSPAHLADVVGAFAAAPLDRRLPLWRALLVDGLEDGGAAYAVTAHRSVTDATGLVRLLGMLHSRTAEHDPARPEPPAPPAAPPVTGPGLLVDELARRGAGLVARPRDAIAGAPQDLLRSLRRAVPGTAAAPRGPLSRRGGQVRVLTAELPHQALHDGAAAAGGSVTDALLAAVAAALRTLDAGPVTIGLPVGDRLAPAVVELDASDLPADAGARVRELREHVLTAGSHRHAGPPDVRVAVLPGVGHTAHLAGARITGLHPLGPLAGSAVAVSLVRHDHLACLGVVVDDAAVPDAAAFTDALTAALEEIS